MNLSESLSVFVLSQKHPLKIEVLAVVRTAAAARAGLAAPWRPRYSQWTAYRLCLCLVCSYWRNVFIITTSDWRLTDIFCMTIKAAAGIFDRAVVVGLCRLRGSVAHLRHLFFQLCDCWRWTDLLRVVLTEDGVVLLQLQRAQRHGLCSVNKRLLSSSVDSAVKRSRE